MMIIILTQGSCKRAIFSVNSSEKYEGTCLNDEFETAKGMCWNVSPETRIELKSHKIS